MEDQALVVTGHPASDPAEEPIDESYYDLHWYGTLSAEGQAMVDRWLAHLIYDEIAVITLTDHTNLTGNLTVVDTASDGEVFLRLVYDVHWDDPFPVDAE